MFNAREPTSSPIFELLLIWVMSKNYRNFNQLRGIDYMYSPMSYGPLWIEIDKVLGPGMGMPTRFACVLMTFSEPYNPKISIQKAWNNACSEWSGWGQNDSDRGANKQYDNCDPCGEAKCCCKHEIYHRCPLFHYGKDNILRVGNCCVMKHPFTDETKQACNDYLEKLKLANKNGISLAKLMARELEDQKQKYEMDKAKRDYQEFLRNRQVETIIHHGSFPVSCPWNCGSQEMDRIGDYWSCKNGCWHPSHNRTQFTHSYNWP